MARVPRYLCDSCERPIEAGTPFCGVCLRPTPWATYQDRTAWEVQQWRRARAPSAGVTSLATLEVTPAARPAATGRNGSSEPKPRAPKPVRALRQRASRHSILGRLVSALRKLFGSSLILRLDPEPDAPSVEPAEPPPPIVLPADPPIVPVPAAAEVNPPAAATDAPASNGNAASPKPPAKPRKRPPPPTNKDLLKQALSVLTKVEQRLVNLEQEVAGIDDAVRGRGPDEPAGGGE